MRRAKWSLCLVQVCVGLGSTRGPPQQGGNTTAGSSRHSLCDVILARGFDAEWTGALVPASLVGKHDGLTDLPELQSMTAECLLHPTFYTVMSLRGWTDDETAGRQLCRRTTATARRLVSDHVHKNTPVELRAVMLASVGARMLLRDKVTASGHFLFSPCEGMKLLLQSLALDPSFLPAYVLARQLAKLLQGKHKPSMWGSPRHRECAQALISRVVTRALSSDRFIRCRHVDSSVIHARANESDAAGSAETHVVRPLFSLGSVALGYVSWAAGGNGNACCTGDIASHEYVLQRLRVFSQLDPHSHPLLLDVGAGIGEFTLLTTHLSRLKVVAFEPGATSRSELRKNILRNGVAEQVQVESLAMSNESGTATLQVLDMSHGHSSIVKRHTGSFLEAGRDVLPSFPATEEMVQVSSLDEWWQQQQSKPRQTAPSTTSAHLTLVGTERVAVIKIDTEGAELMVLLGGSRLIAAHSPEIFVEFSDHTFSFGYHPSQITELLNSMGYYGRHVGDGNGHFVRCCHQDVHGTLQKAQDSFCRTVECAR